MIDAQTNPSPNHRVKNHYRWAKYHHHRCPFSFTQVSPPKKIAICAQRKMSVKITKWKHRRQYLTRLSSNRLLSDPNLRQNSQFFLHLPSRLSQASDRYEVHSALSLLYPKEMLADFSSSFCNNYFHRYILFLFCNLFILLTNDFAIFKRFAMVYGYRNL